MKTKVKIVLMGLLLVFGSCKQKNSEAQPRFKSQLKGYWESTELEEEGNSFSHKELILTNSTWHLSVYAYADAKGHDPLFQLEFEGNYEITGASPIVEGSWNGTYRIDKKYLTLLNRNPEVVQELGFASCGLTYGERKDVSNGCSFVESIADCPVDYDLVTIREGMLYAGKRNSDMCVPEGRPKLHGNPFQRMNLKKTKSLSADKIFPTDAELNVLADNLQFLEGPIWNAEKERLIFSEVNGNTLWQWTEANGVSEYLKPSFYAGGNTFDHEGNIISCQGGARRLVRVGNDGNSTVLTDNYNGKKFNSPNDAIVKSDGTIWFTDPDYGLLAVYGENANEHKELDGNYIFRYDPRNGTTSLLCTSLSKPNGLAFSQDESVLYVGNSAEGDRCIMAFGVLTNNTLGKVKLITTIESKTWGVDGLKVGSDGNLYAACGDGVNIFSPFGELIHRITTDFEVTNLSFGSNANTLFLTGHEALYKTTFKNN
ncbi:MAG: SMP-30/gluconolactonase/LRE family protein [Bacteroidota bacterium]